MSLWYSIWESPHHWALLAAIVFTVGIAITIFMLAVGWPHSLDRLWLYLVLVATAILVGLEVREWVLRTEAAIETSGQDSADEPNEQTS